MNSKTINVKLTSEQVDAIRQKVDSALKADEALSILTLSSRSTREVKDKLADDLDARITMWRGLITALEVATKPKE